MNLCEVLALYGQALAPDEPVRLLIHHARDFNCSASLAAPMLRSKTVKQAPNPARAPERTQRDTLRRLLPEAVASATDIEIGEAAAASDARKEAEHHQRPHCATLLQDAAREEPSNARTVKYVEEKWQKAAAEKEASEREVLHIHDEVVATGSQPTMPATRSPEEQDAMAKLQELARLDQRAEQLRSAAIALRTSAARNGADDAAVCQRQQLAMQAQLDALAYRVELERVDPIFAGKSNAAVLRSEAQAAGRDFKSFASTFQRLKELAFANRSHLQRLVEVVGNHPKISPQAQKQVQQLVKQTMAPTGIATGRPPRKTAGRSAAATYPRGAQHLPAPASAPPVSGAALVGRRVVVAGALHGRAADWLEGAVAKHHPRKGGYSIDFSDKSLRTLHVQLPHPEKQVLFLPEDSSSAPVATLPALADSPQAAWTAHETWMASRTSSAPQAADRMPTISNVERALLDEGRGPSLNPRLWAEQIPITPAMMDRLRDPRPRATATECKAHELNDEIVNAVVAALNRDNTDTHAFVFSTFMYSALENEAVDSDTVQRLLRAAPPASDLLSREQLLFMVNVPETSARPGHWYLAQANIAVGQIVAFDSAGQSHPDAIRVVQTFLEALHAKEFAGRPTWMLTDSWLGVSFGNRTPLQENGHDCGVYMLAIAWCLIRRVPLRAALDNTRMLSNPESYWRARITVWLLNGSTKHLPDPPAV